MTTNNTPDSRSTGKWTLLILGASVLIFAALAIRRCGGILTHYVDPMVTVERTPFDDLTVAKVMPPQPPPAQENPEVYRTADRLREASAFALGAALYAANELAVGHRLPDLQTLIAGMLSANLLPPGLELRGPANLASALGNLLLRLRPDPLTIEVIDTPLRRQDGPALMVRIPGSGPNSEAGSIFIADRLGDVVPPAPFAPLSECVRAGWIDQPFNQTEIAPGEQQQLRAWLLSKAHQ